MSSNVTIIVPTFNRAEYIGACLDSLLNLSLKAQRIIVLDDGSTDDTASVLKSYGSAIETVRKENGGKSSALNLALPMVESEYVWIFDDDDVACPDALKHHLDALDGHSEYGFSYSSYKRADSGVQGGILPGPTRHVAPYSGRGLFVRLLEENFLPQPSILVRADCYRELGPFDEELVRSQDYDMLLRLSRRFPATAVDQVTYYYRRHDGTRGSDQDSFAATSVSDRWVKYDRMIFERLHRELDLWEYLPDLSKERPLAPIDRRRALIRRFAIMMRYCLWDHALMDLEAILEGRTQEGALTADERDVLRRIFDNRASLMFRWGFDGQRLRSSFDEGNDKLADPIRLEMSKTLYYELRRDLRTSHYRAALPKLKQLVSLLGARGLFRHFSKADRVQA